MLAGKKTASSRTQIQIKEVRDNILVLPFNKYCAVLETSSVNFELKSESEQDVIIEGYQNFLNSLSFPLQILVRIREVYIEDYLQTIQAKVIQETHEDQKKQLLNYSDFLQSLVQGNKILSRKFYIVVPCSSFKKSDFSLVQEQMQLNVEIVNKGLEKIGMKARQLDNFELLNLFYSFYNSGKINVQDLRADSVQETLTHTYGI